MADTPMDFPASPTIGQKYINAEGTVYIWDGYSWAIYGTAQPPADTWGVPFARVKAAIPGATDAVIRQQMTAVMLDFTQQTNLWVENVGFTTQDSRLEYQLSIVNGMANRLICVYDPRNQPPRWYSDGISMPVPGTITFWRQPETGVDLIATVAKATFDMALDGMADAKPTGYPVIDAWIINKYQDALYYGTMAYLQMQPTKTYTNPKLAAFNLQNYISQRSKARAEGVKANIYGGQNWSFPQGFASIDRKGWT